MLEPVKKNFFRELPSGRVVECNPAQVRMIRMVDGGVEIVFTETHSITVKGSRAGVSKILWGTEPSSSAKGLDNHLAGATAPN